MRAIADLHLHSKYARATSPNMNLESMGREAKLKGIDILATGDFTHPSWFEELQKKLRGNETENGSGIYEFGGSQFILSTEVSNIFSVKKIVKRVHNIILAPSLEIVEQINEALAARGGKLASDGRPMLGMSCAELVEIVMDVSNENMIIPAHLWTPWFSCLGSMGGFDSVEDCYEDQTKHIHALETGLSSDPAMNWRLSALDKYALVSNSDAHSPQKMGREANVFDLEKLSYKELTDAIRKKDKTKFLYTIEFFPQKGKYHYDGHRDCGVCMAPKEAIKHNNICTVCRKKLTIGVEHRVEALADRPEGFVPPNAIPFKSIVPLRELIAKVMRKPEASAKVNEIYSKLVPALGNEFDVLLAADTRKVAKVSELELLGKVLADMRAGIIEVKPGYDGVYGEFVLGEEAAREKAASHKDQAKLDEF